MKKVIVRRNFEYVDTPGLVCGPGKTRQEFIQECDVNTIMANALRTGTVPTRTDMARYGDFSSGADYFEAQNILIKGREQFMALSSKVREKFGNDPGKFLAWIHDEKVSLEEKHELGLLSEEGVRKVAERVSKREADKAAAAAAK